MYHAAFHPLTPGSPAYALAKFGAVGAVFALRMFLVRRERRGEEPEAVVQPPASSHPKGRRSRKRR